MDFNHRIGALLRDYRMKAGLSQDTVAELASITPSSLSRVENGRQPVLLETFLTLSKILHMDNLTVRELMVDDDDEPRPLWERINE